MTEDDYDLIDVDAVVNLSDEFLAAIYRHYRRRQPHSRSAILETLNSLAAVAVQVIANTEFSEDANQCFAEAVIDQMNFAQAAKTQQ